MIKPPPPDRAAVAGAARATLRQARYRVLDRDWDSRDGHQLDLIAEAPGKAGRRLDAGPRPGRMRAPRPHDGQVTHPPTPPGRAVAWATVHGLCYAVIQVDVFGLDHDGRPVHVKAVS